MRQARQRRQPIGFAGYRRSHLAHDLNVRRDKGRLASSTAIFSCSRSRSISAAPSLAFSRSLSSSSPVADFVAKDTTLGCLAGGEKCIAPPAQRRRRDAETARDGLKVFAPQQPQHRCGLPLPRHPATPAGRRCARLLRSLRIAPPRFNVLLLIHLTPLQRNSSAYGVSQSTVRRGNPILRRELRRAQVQAFFGKLAPTEVALVSVLWLPSLGTSVEPSGPSDKADPTAVRKALCQAGDE
jgi:hypothetical protein